MTISYDTIEFIHAIFVFLWISGLFLTLIFAAISWLQASKSLPTGGMAIVRFTTLMSVTTAAIVLMTGLMLYATGKWPTGDGAALVLGTILLLVVTIPGSLLLYSAARTLLNAAAGSHEVTTYARRIVMICSVQFLLILLATLRGLHAAGHLG